MKTTALMWSPVEHTNPTNSEVPILTTSNVIYSKFLMDTSRQDEYTIMYFVKGKSKDF